MKLKYIKELDGVRGAAAVMIILFHFFQHLHVERSDLFLTGIQKVSRFGQTGVTLFFVLSGFLITRILLATKNHKNYFSSFYMRRSLRIFPLYYFFLILSFFTIPYVLNGGWLPWNQQIYYWTYIQNIALTFHWLHSGPGQLWSLAVEEHFYLFWPLLIFYLDPKQIKTAIIVIFLVALLSRILLVLNGYGTFYFTLSNMDALAMGSLLALDELKGINKVFYGRLFLIVIIPTIVLWMFVGGNGNEIIQILKLPLNAITYYGFIGFVVGSQSKGIVSKVCTSRFFNYTGKISYGLYVYHPMVFYLYERYVNLNSLLLNMACSILLSYLVATLSYYLFEVKVLKLKRYFEYSSEIKKPISLKT